jgi:O-antigen/teichoic acid export membrane protein
MAVKVQSIAKNTSYLTLALILQKIISFFYFTLLARFLGPENLGKYYFAISFTTIFAIIIDLGLANVVIREVAKKQERAGKLLGSVLAMKIPLAVLSIISAVLIIKLSEADPLVRSLVYISCFSMVLDSFTTTFYAATRGFHNLKYESISAVIFQIIVLVFGYGALLLGKGLTFAMAALALASLYNFAYSWLIAVYKIKVKIKLSFDYKVIRQIILIGWPFALYAIFQRVFTFLDSVLLSYLAGDVQVGLYQVAFKIVFALQFLPLAFTASLYPALSAYWQNNKRQLGVTFERSLNYLTIISLPIIAGIFLLADKIILLFKDGYGSSVLPLKIAIFSLFFIFLNFPIGSLLNACDRQKVNTFNMIKTAVLSVALNLILIPHYQAAGAAMAVLISNAFMFVLGVRAVKGIMPYDWRKNLSLLIKTMLASLVMAGFIVLTRATWSFFLVAVLSAVLYFLFLYIFKGYSREDVRSIFKSFKL